METRRGEARAWVVRATSAATRLANVVCRPRLVSAESMVCADRDRLVARQTASRRAVRGKPVSRKSTALYSRDVVSISIHERGGTPTNRRLVEAASARRIFAQRFARRRSVDRLLQRFEANGIRGYISRCEGRADRDGRNRNPSFAGDNVPSR